jgi:hypothetical protein
MKCFFEEITVGEASTVLLYYIKNKKQIVQQETQKIKNKKDSLLRVGAN